MSRLLTPGGHSLGLMPGMRDARDYPFSMPRAMIGTVPITFDKRAAVKTIFDQGQLGSCTGQAYVGGLRMLLAKRKQPDFMGSRLAAYYLGREFIGTTEVDSGAQIRDVIKAGNKTGTVPETDWPYDIRRFTERPPLDNARAHDIDAYQAVPNSVTQLRAAIYANWHVIIGIAIYESFETATVASTGKVPLPQPQSEQLFGWHAVYLVGWTKTTFYGVNSWGGWGNKGTFTIPNAFLENPQIAGEFWTMSAT